MSRWFIKMRKWCISECLLSSMEKNIWAWHMIKIAECHASTQLEWQSQSDKMVFITTQWITVPDPNLQKGHSNLLFLSLVWCWFSILKVESESVLTYIESYGFASSDNKLQSRVGNSNQSNKQKESVVDLLLNVDALLAISRSPLKSTAPPFTVTMAYFDPYPFHC